MRHQPAAPPAERPTTERGAEEGAGRPEGTSSAPVTRRGGPPRLIGEVLARFLAETDARRGFKKGR